MKGPTWGPESMDAEGHPRGEVTMDEEQGSLTGPLMTVAEVAEVLRVSTMTVYRLIKAGELPALRVGKNYRIRAGDLETYLATGEVRADETNG